MGHKDKKGSCHGTHRHSSGVQATRKKNKSDSFYIFYVFCVFSGFYSNFSLTCSHYLAILSKKQGFWDTQRCIN
jgi:hypothetical protein